MVGRGEGEDQPNFMFIKVSVAGLSVQLDTNPIGSLQRSTLCLLRQRQTGKINIRQNVCKLLNCGQKSLLLISDETCFIVQTFIIIQRNSFTVGSLVLSKEKWNKKKPNKEKQNFLWLWGYFSIIDWQWFHRVSLNCLQVSLGLKQIIIIGIIRRGISPAL